MPTADFFDCESLLSVAERQKLGELRVFSATEIEPFAGQWWQSEQVPRSVFQRLSSLGFGAPFSSGQSRLFSGLATLELCRADLSTGAIFGIHHELFTEGIRIFGTAEQKHRFLRPAQEGEILGGFALTEPEHGSDVAGGLATTVRRDGDGWLLNGAKRWIGNAIDGDYVFLWARDADDKQIRGFILDLNLPGVSRQKIENKISMRGIKNANITLQDVRLAEADRLSTIDSFADTNVLLLGTRMMAGWMATGVQFAAYDIAREYALKRLQFGKPLAKFQLIQQQLVEMLGNITASLSMTARAARIQDAHDQGLGPSLRMEQAALVKAYTSKRCLETVALGRSILGGNGIVTDFGMAKIFADAQPILTFEGTYEVNSLIVGRAITGHSALL
ncbi:acyl-CoA dehydrogenase [Psychromicrobium lacuslunae]|uniref:Acyl-CoA dehydrogenase n=1 Tax=Psychromicrobium lacuslunae TaxID=1618207 RepID=A0A0D4C3R8_9MICC|nr:acyl-CoA dehydrogenase [Psychromicrobium lacuslunae]